MHIGGGNGGRLNYLGWGSVVCACIFIFVGGCVFVAGFFASVSCDPTTTGACDTGKSLLIAGAILIAIGGAFGIASIFGCIGILTCCRTYDPITTPIVPHAAHPANGQPARTPVSNPYLSSVAFSSATANSSSPAPAAQAPSSAPGGPQGYNNNSHGAYPSDRYVQMPDSMPAAPSAYQPSAPPPAYQPAQPPQAMAYPPSQYQAPAYHPPPPAAAVPERVYDGHEYAQPAIPPVGRGW